VTWAKFTMVLQAFKFPEKKDFKVTYALTITEPPGEPVYSGVGCGSSARVVLIGGGWSNLVALLTQNPFM